MPKVRCRCGHVINLSPIPAEEQYTFISDTDWEFFIADVRSMIEADPGMAAEDITHKIAALTADHYRNFLRCSSCERLIFFWKSGKRGEFYLTDTFDP